MVFGLLLWRGSKAILRIRLNLSSSGPINLIHGKFYVASHKVKKFFKKPLNTLCWLARARKKQHATITFLKYNFLFITLVIKFRWNTQKNFDENLVIASPLGLSATYAYLLLVLWRQPIIFGLHFAYRKYNFHYEV